MKLKILHLTLCLFLTMTLGTCQNRTEGTYFKKVGALQLHYTIRGSGPIMIVGHPNSGKIGYEMSLQPLEDHFTMVYYEPRGTGKSETPQTMDAYQSNYLVQEIEDLRALLKTDKIWIFGHSDQSALALQYALKYPDHTAGLILSGTSLIGTQQESVDRRKAIEQQRAQESEWFAQVLKDWDYMELHKTTTNLNGKDLSAAPIKWWCYDETTFQKILPMVQAISKAGRRKPIHNQYYSETPTERQQYLDHQQNFSNIQTKVLIINGKFDTNNPPQYAEDLHKVLPHSKLVLIEKSGHFPWVENADEAFKEINKWLKEVGE